MIATNEDLEGHLTRLARGFERAEGGDVYLVSMGPGQPLCALSISPPVLVAQVRVAVAPPRDDAGSARFLRRLLELNAGGLLHAAFGIEGGQILLTAALELQNLDTNELEAVLGDLDQALAEHVPGLVSLSKSLGLG
ncbi:MAG TPA: CesT family type III secretion system chaperone, partial [Polyangiaceae bacterium]|nr:CesT family type III secretion system chaperone [Polyangiaceae bacterium]